MLVDKPLAELEQYHPPLTRQPDFESFWEQSLAASAAQPLNATVEAVDYPTDRVAVYDVRYDGFSASGEVDTRIAGWYITPRDHLTVNGKTPTIIVYHGYSGSRGLPANHLHWAALGYNVFAVDTRGHIGDTPDNNPYPTGAAVLGCMTKGIADPATYYYRFVYLDCVRAVDVVRSRPETGPILLTGASQGGGLTLAVAALASGGDIIAAMPDVPFLCHFERALEAFSDGPYYELVNYWRAWPHRVEQGYRTLSYFDGMNFAPRIQRPVLLSVALLDTLCPPSTGFAVYHHLGTSEKTLKVYQYNGHQGGGAHHDEEKYRFARQMLAKYT